MPDRAPPELKGPSALAIAGSLLLGLGFLALAFRRLDWQAVGRVLAEAQLLPFLPLGVLSYLGGHVLRGWRCRLLVSREATISFPAATGVVVVGYAVNNILPFRMGELVRAGMLSQRTGTGVVQSLTVTFVERLFDGLTLLALLLMTVAVLPAGGWIEDSVPVVGLVLSLAVLGTGFALLCPGLLQGLAARLAGRRWQDRALRLSAQIVRGVTYLRDPADALRVAVLSVLIWCLEAGLYLALLPAVGLPVHPGWALLAMTVTNLGILVPSSPGYIGPFHFLCMQALVSLGAGTAVAFSYAVTVHLAFFLPITVWGIGILWWHSLALGATLASVRSARRLPAASLDDDEPWERIAHGPWLRQGGGASPFLVALTEAALPLDEPPDDRTARRRAVDRSAAFLHGQLGSLTARLRWMMRTGILAFRGLVWLRHPRGFAKLPRERRQRIFDSWAYGGFAPARQLMRPIRSIALLAFYESPEVLQALAEIPGTLAENAG